MRMTEPLSRRWIAMTGWSARKGLRLSGINQQRDGSLAPVFLFARLRHMLADEVDKGADTRTHRPIAIVDGAEGHLYRQQFV